MCCLILIYIFIGGQALSEAHEGLATKDRQAQMSATTIAELHRKFDELQRNTAAQLAQLQAALAGSEKHAEGLKQQLGAARERAEWALHRRCVQTCGRHVPHTHYKALVRTVSSTITQHLWPLPDINPI